MKPLHGHGAETHLFSFLTPEEMASVRLVSKAALPVFNTAIAQNTVRLNHATQNLQSFIKRQDIAFSPEVVTKANEDLEAYALRENIRYAGTRKTNFGCC